MKFLYLWLCAVIALSAHAALADTYNLTIDEFETEIAGKTVTSLGINGSSPGPVLRWREGETVTIHVTNNLAEDTSLHWHGILLPNDQDGVPGLTFSGIKPGQTFTYTFTLTQSGTYWYHSHSGFQEPKGVFGALVIEPAADDPVSSDREHVLVLSDWLNDNPKTVFANLKKQGHFYNYNKNTLGDFFRELTDAADRKARRAVINGRLMWGKMRMDPTDIADISGYDFLINGQGNRAGQNFRFRPGEKIRLRIINAAAMTFFDFRIPGLKMTVVQADGQNVVPVAVDEIRLGVAETYDVIVEPQPGKTYALFAQSQDRTGFGLASLGQTAGIVPPVPAMDIRETRPMIHDMEDGSQIDMAAGEEDCTPEHEAMGHCTPTASTGRHKLSYDDLKPLAPLPDRQPPTREIPLFLTGVMERYIWSFNGRKYSDADPVIVNFGERVRLTYKNETMMDHPIHLHGLWMDRVEADGRLGVRKHTFIVPPGETLQVDVSADAVGRWALHCHLMFHMAAGMFREFRVLPPVKGAAS